MGIVGLCSDHAGFELKEYIKTILDERGLSYKDFGTYSSDSCDYPDFAHLMGKAVEAGEVYPGIAVCGTGNGISMTLNKHRGVRAALCWLEDIAKLAREHNDANVLSMPGDPGGRYRPRRGVCRDLRHAGAAAASGAGAGERGDHQ